MLEEEDAPTRMSEPDGDLLAMLQRARVVDEAQADVEPHRRRKAKAVTLGPDEEDVPTLVRTDISVEQLEERALPANADIEPDAADRGIAAEDLEGSLAPSALGGLPPTSRLPEPSPRNRFPIWVLGIVLVVCVIGIALWLQARL